jgi:hypothetical protein
VAVAWFVDALLAGESGLVTVAAYASLVTALGVPDAKGPGGRLTVEVIAGR